MISKTYDSSSSDAKYTATFYPETGVILCDTKCPGFRYSKTEPRSCKHTKDLAKLVAGGFRGEAASQEAQSQAPAPVASPEGAGARYKPMLASELDGRYKDHEGQILWDMVEADYGGGTEWLMEEKIDGHRLMFRNSGGKITAWSRPTSARGSKDRVLPAHLVRALEELPEGVYDGELYVPGGTSSDVTKRERQRDLRIAMFDLVEIMGATVTDLTWVERRAMLDLSISHHVNQHDDADTVIQVLPAVPVTRTAVQAIWDREGEGAILKRCTDSQGRSCGYYKQGWRSTDWIKLKREGTVECTILEFTAGESGPFSMVKLVTPDGVPTSVKAKNAEWRRKFQANPDAYIGRTMVVRFTERTPPTARFQYGSLRHPRADHIKGEGE